MKSKNSNFEFRSKSQVFSEHVFISRNGEERMGDFLIKDNQPQKFCILGISEAIGPFANYGRTGAEYAFAAFFKHFISWPFQGQSVQILGNVRFIGNFPEEATKASLFVEELDEFIYTILNERIAENQIPIVIGGGHNNALPLMRWAKKNRQFQNVINFDAHTDCRTPNRRHSGNSFSYALKENILEKYIAFGVQAHGVTPAMQHIINDFGAKVFSYESYLLGEYNLTDKVQFFLNNKNGNIGIEIDMDSIAYMPSSASSPSGWSLDELRRILLVINSTQVAYLHLTEAAVFEASNERIVGRALALLSLDFIGLKE